ncbi:unnamed protein product [Adineta ricciae]|uniref:F-box domain-containing protein n=1 Tax=Adineta ricciae TaxID=249248 RepID=A0A815SRC2_ADIRI|nr:unnamed protein product [Adineta ricciae]
MSDLSNMKAVQLLDLPDELILAIIKKVHPQVLLFCSMIDIDNNRLKQLAFDGCHSIDFTFDYINAPHRSLMKRFYSDVMPLIGNSIQSLTIDLHHIRPIDEYHQNTDNKTLKNLRHLKIMLGAKRSKTGVPYTIVNHHMCYPEMRKPLLSIVPQYFLLRNDIQSFELDDNCLLSNSITGKQLRIPEAVQLTHIRISFWNFAQCVGLLIQLGCQLQSLTVTIAMSDENRETLNNVIQSISCPNLKHLTIKMYRNFKNFDVCLCLLERLSSVEHLTLLLAIDETNTTSIHFIDQLFSEKNIYRCMPNLHQFHFHIRSIFKGASQTTADQILQGFVKREQHQSFHCVIDHFNNSYGQCQIYSLPFIGTRLDFVSNRFPFFDNHSTFSSVTTMLLFDDVEPFENVFFERIAQVLPRLRTLEIINPLEQKKKSAVTKTNIIFPHLTVLILYDNHMDYTELFLYGIHLPSLIELAIDKDMLFSLIAQNQQRTSDNCSRLRIIHTSKPSYESKDAIQKFFPQVDYLVHVKDRM